MKNNTVSSNTAFGYSAMQNTSNGSFNTATGAFALQSNNSGTANTANGMRALNANTGGSSNTACGTYSMEYNSSGSFNTAFGMNALNTNTGGNSNTAIGSSALLSSTGGNNTACGASALTTNTTGSYNSAIGYYADVASGSLTNANAIGSFSRAGASNTLVLGSINGVNGATATVNVGIGTNTPSERLDVSGGNIRTNQQLVSTVVTGTAPIIVSSTTSVINLNADLLDGLHAGNADGQIPISNLTVNTNLNSDLLDGLNAGNAEGQIPISNSTVNINLNADLLDGQHSTTFAPVSGSGNYIQNGTSLQSSSNFNISGNGYIGGNVGIGTTSPAAKLDVNGTMKMSNLLFYPPTGDPSPTITARTVPAGQGNSTEKTELILFHGNDNAGGAGVDQISLRAPALNFQTFDNTSVNDVENDAGYNVRMYINPAGNVGIGTTSPGDKLHVDGSIRAKFNLYALSNNSSQTLAGMRHDGNDLLYVFNDNACNNGVYLAEGGTSWLAFSDARLKKDVEPFKNILDNVCQLNAKRFHMITDPDTMTKRMGFIAQDVQRLFPDIVNSESGFLALSYSDFGVLSIEAIKELRAEKDAEIAALKNENGELEKKLESLQAQIEQIKEYLEMASQR